MSFSRLTQPVVRALATADAAPGLPSRMEVATGLLIQRISINGNPLLVSDCTVTQQQEVDLKHFVQGGPRGAISNVGQKWYEGQITTTIKVDSSNSLPLAIRAILEHAANPISGLRIDTNYLLSHIAPTVDEPGSDNNDLVSLDCAVVKQLSLKAGPSGGIKLTIDIEGMMDTRIAGSYVELPESGLMYRELTWADCDISRYDSAMRSTLSMELVIENEVEKRAWMPPITQTVRNDQIDLLAVKHTKWRGSFVEAVRLGADVHTLIHGGTVVDGNLTLDFGAFRALVPHPLFKPAMQKLSPNMMQRTTNFFSQVSPSNKNMLGVLFEF